MFVQKLKKIKKTITKKYLRSRYPYAKSIFENAVPYRNFLPAEEFEKFIAKYIDKEAKPRQDYTTDGLERQANERYNLISKQINASYESVLEIGPGKGYVLKKFKEHGFKKAVGVDIVDNRTLEVIKQGVDWQLSSADDLNVIPDKTFDLVISWSALEHIPNPQKVVSECLRVLKPGGLLYCAFGPLYYSPWGYHHYSAIKAPYLHILFPEKLILDYAKNHGKHDGYIPWTNGCTVEDYQFLKLKLPKDYFLESYNSGFDCYSIDIILKYPEVFRSKGIPFENFFVDAIEFSIRRHLPSIQMTDKPI